MAALLPAVLVLNSSKLDSRFLSSSAEPYGLVSLNQTKRKYTSTVGVFSLAGHVAQNWNTILLSLMAMYEKLVELDASMGREGLPP